MVNDYSAVIEAIDRLTTAVNQTSNSFVSECISTVLTMVGSIATVLIFEVIKGRYFAPRDEFKKLRRKVNSTLSMFACYYTNQIDLARSNAEEIERYSSASKSMREMAVELMAFADDFQGKKCCGVPISNVSEAAALLMRLSNSFFTPYNCPEMAENRDNDKMRKEIRELLEIDHPC